MSADHAARLAALEQLDEDLFDFPDVDGMSDLLAAARVAAAEGAPADPAKATPNRSRAVDSAHDELRAPLPAPKASQRTSANRSGAAPRNAADLDEDLFGFGELLELGAPSDFGPTPSLLDPRPGDGRAPMAGRKEPEARASTPIVAPAPARAPAPAPAPAATSKPAADRAREPKRKKSEAEPRTGGAPEATRKRAHAPVGHAMAGDASPFLSFPTDIDLPPARSKLLWVLVGCFLLANGGVFLMTQQQNQKVNETLVAVTSTLAEAVARGSNAAPREVPTYREPVVSAVDPPRVSAPMLDPADFSNTNELGLHNARRLIEQGAYAEARRNLFFILANQDRSTPLTPSLREDIDYLIALTYYDQGRSIAVEASR